MNIGKYTNQLSEYMEYKKYDIKTINMKNNINCCGIFNKMVKNFGWFSFHDENGKKVFVLPAIKHNGINFKVNYCPSCGKSIDGIELRDDDQ